MSSHFPCRLIVDPPQSGAWNMAVDEALLTEAATEGLATLRFYEWSEPTLSLGYFQKYADRAQHPASASAAVVRRQSGGGAILHDHELTYSLALPRKHSLVLDAQRLYMTVHEVIATVLRNTLPQVHSPRSLRFAEQVEVDKKKTEPFLCFQRRSAGDLVFIAKLSNQVADNHKIVGSAQRRSRGAVLQHGSILLWRSEFGPELAGLGDLCDNALATTCLTSELSAQLLQALDLDEQGETCERKLGNRCRALAARLRDEKYGNRVWTQKS